VTVVRRNAATDVPALMLARENARKDADAERLLSNELRAMIDVFAPLLIAADPVEFPDEQAVRQKVKQRIKARL
jgi:hypothetical protein